MKRSKEIRKIVGKVSLILGVLYIGMMGLFTWLQIRSCVEIQSAATSRLYETVEYLFTNEMQIYAQQNLEKNEDISYEDTLAEIATQVRYRMNMMNHKAFYSKVAFFDADGEEILRPGNMLSVTEGPFRVIQADGMTRGQKERFVNLDKYMTQEEIIQFFEVAHDKVRYSEYDLRVRGYLQGGEVIPEYIEVCDVSGDVSKSVCTYAFEVPNKEMLIPIESDLALDYFEAVPRVGQNINALESFIMNKTTIERFASCNERLDTEGEDVKIEDGIRSLGGENTWYRKEAGITRPITVAGEVYYMSIASVFFPYEIMMPTLLPIYLFCLVAIGVLGVILTKGLIAIYEQQVSIENSRRKLIDAIGHELKTPLGIIHTYSEMIKANRVPEKRDYYTDVVMDEVDKMDRLVLEMLDLSKLESKAYMLKEEVFDLEHIVKSVVTEKNPLFDAKEADMYIESDGNTHIQADYSRMKQVLGNLLDNAVTHISQKGRIEIKLEDGRLSIANNGPPIDDEVMAHLWDAFYKGKRNETSEIIRGTGLGLAIVKHLLELHGMAYGARNTEEGVMFWIDFSDRRVGTQKDV